MKRLMKMMLAVSLFWGANAQAAMITYTFEAIVVDGTFAGQSGNGSFTFDDTLVLETTDIQTLGFSGSMFAQWEALTDFSFTFLGQTFGGTDDSGYPDTPTVDLFENVPDYLDFFVEDGVGVDILNSLILNFQLVGFLTDGPASGSNYDFVVDMFIEERTLNDVAAPSAFILMLISVLWAQRRYS